MRPELEGIAEPAFTFIDCKRKLAKDIYATIMKHLCKGNSGLVKQMLEVLDGSLEKCYQKTYKLVNVVVEAKMVNFFAANEEYNHEFDITYTK